MSFSKLAHMTDRNVNAGSTEQWSKAKPNTFYEAFYKTEINPEESCQLHQIQLKT